MDIPISSRPGYKGKLNPWCGMESANIAGVLCLEVFILCLILITYLFTTHKMSEEAAVGSFMSTVE